MTAIRTVFLSCALIAAATHAAGPHLLSAPGPRAQDSAPQGAIAKRVGAIKAITGNSISLTPDTGSVVNVTVQDNTRILRVAPGQKSLKDATPMTLEELQVGDRILVSGKESGD